MPHATGRRREIFWVAAIWICFLVRGFFYASIIPLWEGYDEWAHFGYAQHVLAHGSLPLGETTRVSREIEASFQLLPLPWAMHDISGTKVTHDMYWRLPREEQAERSRKLRSIPRDWEREFAQDQILLYEAQQPPLYYWLLAGPLHVLRDLPLPERVYLLRYLSLLAASVVIPIGYLVVRRALGDRSLAFGVIAVIALMPEFILELSRVANDSLATALYSVLLWLGLKALDEPGRSGWALAYGLTLGLGLLTKAYFLTAVPATALLLLWLCWSGKDQRRSILRNACIIAGIALAVAGWWYVRCRLLTGSWSGLQQDVSLRNVPWRVFLQRIADINWRVAFDNFFVSHIYFGNWSFLQLRYWIYHFFRYLALLGVAGYIVFLWRWYKTGQARPGTVDGRPVNLAATFYLMFAAGLAYHVMITFADGGGSSTNGWYIYSLVIAELLAATAGTLAILPAGLHSWFLPSLAVCFALLDLYAAHFVLIPYYTGLIAHNAGGALATFHIGQYSTEGIGLAISRLLHNKPAFWNESALLAAWIMLLAATVGTVAFSIRLRAK